MIIPVTLTGLSAAAILAADVTSSPVDPFNWVTGLGFPGVIIALLVSGYLRTKPEVDRLTADNAAKDAIIARKDEQIDALHATIAEQALPALAESTRVLEAIPDSETNLIQQLRRATEAIERQRRRGRK